MRRRTPRQSDIFAPAVDHDLSRELGEIDAVLRAHPEWECWVHADLTRGVDAGAGRGGTPASQVLRVAVAQRRLNMKLRRFAFLLEDSLSWREFIGLGLTDRTPKRSTLQENLQKIQPATWGKLIKGLVTSDEAREIETGEKVRTDAPVTKSNVHTPSDSSFLWDCGQSSNVRSAPSVPRWRRGTISFLERALGLDRCTWQGAGRFASYVWSAVFARSVARHPGRGFRGPERAAQAY